MAQAARLASRLQRELKMLQLDPPPGVGAWPCDDLLTHLQAQIMGPQDTVYSNGIFKLDVQVPERYPFEPPNIRFVTPVYHPNIDSGGRICLDILNLPPKGAWRPSLNLATLLASIGLLLAEPNPDDGLMGDITAEYKHNRASFDAKARKWTELYATQDQVAQLVAPDSQLPDQVPKVEKPPYAVSVETLASTGRRDCQTGEETTGNGVARYGTSSQLTRPGSSISKRLTLERGTQSLVSCKADSDFCQQSKVEIQRTIIGGDDNSPAILPAEKRYTVVSCKENVIQDNGARKMGEANLSKLVAEVTKQGDSDKDEHADICGAIDLGKGKSVTEILQQAKGCKDRHMNICTDNVPIIEGNRRGNSVKGFSNQTMVTDMGRDTLLDVPCSLPTEACKAVSLGTENSTPAMKAVEWTNVRCTDKENQSPKDAVTYATLTSKAAEKVKSPSFAPISGRGKLKLMKEASEQVRPTKSLKLSRTKDEQSSPALSTQSCKHTTDIQKRWDSLIVITEDFPTVVVSDTDSDDEPSDFRISLTQRSLNRKRNVSSKLR